VKFASAWLSILVATVFALRVTAQVSLAPTTPRFQEISRLAQEGYGDSARAIIARILGKTAETDASFPEALYTSGFIARTGDSMRSVFARIVVDFPASAWADKALVRLAQLEFGFNNMDKVVTDISRLFTDYPSSVMLATGALWGARAAFRQQKMQLGCDWLTRGITTAGDDLELKNQLQFAKQSCNIGPGVQYAPVVAESLRAGPPPRPVTDTTAAPVPPPPPPPPPTPPPPAPAPAPAPKGGKPPTAKAAAANPASPWRVQVAAISDIAVIHRVEQQIVVAGFKAYTAPGPKGLTKVQAGPFATRAAAVAQLAKLKAAIGGSPFVVPAP
jgi:cell division septation protein DedD